MFGKIDGVDGPVSGRFNDNVALRQACADFEEAEACVATHIDHTPTHSPRLSFASPLRDAIKRRDASLTCVFGIRARSVAEVLLKAKVVAGCHQTLGCEDPRVAQHSTELLLEALPILQRAVENLGADQVQYDGHARDRPTWLGRVSSLAWIARLPGER